MSAEAILREIAELASDGQHAAAECVCGIYGAHDALAEIARIAKEEVDRLRYFAGDGQ